MSVEPSIENQRAAGVVLHRLVRRGFEPETSVKSLGWIGKRVESRLEERGHFYVVASEDDRPHVGEWGWFYTTCGEWLHSSEVYPPNPMMSQPGQDAKPEAGSSEN